MAADGAPVAPVTAWDCQNLDKSDQLYWQQKGVELKSSEGTRITEASTKWTGVLSAVAGVAAITAVLSSYDELRTLSRAWQIGIIATLLVALGLIVFANISAYRAEVGNFQKFAATAENTCDYFLSQPMVRTAEITKSKIATFAGLALLVAAILALGLAPRESSAKTFVAIQTTGDSRCGVLQTDASGIVTIVDKPGGAALLRIADDTKLAELIEVPSCGTPE